MKPFVAIVKSTAGGLDKYQDFDLEADAASHVGTYGGFVVSDPGGDIKYWVVDAEAQTVVNDQVQADADALASSWDRLRKERNALLVSSDWTQGNDSPLTDEVKISWATHREILRNLPATHAADPNAVVWPDTPE